MVSGRDLIGWGEQLDDLLTEADTILDNATLDQIDHIVAPGHDVGTIQMVYTPPALTQPSLRRRPSSDRTAA